MRWEQLFSDLEAQLAAEQRSETDAEVAERVRIELGEVTLGSRLRAHLGSRLRLHAGPVRLVGAVLEVGADFVLLAEDGGGRSLVPTAAVGSVSGLGRAAAPVPGGVLRALRFTSALRGLAADRSEVRVVTDHDELRGTLSRVAADHVDLLGQASDVGQGAAAGLWSVPLAAVRVVRSR